MSGQNSLPCPEIEQGRTVSVMASVRYTYLNSAEYSLFKMTQFNKPRKQFFILS